MARQPGRAEENSGPKISLHIWNRARSRANGQPAQGLTDWRHLSAAPLRDALPPICPLRHLQEPPILARVISRALDGLKGLRAHVEVYISGSIPGLIVVGLPDAAIKESRERVRSAIPSSWTRWR